MCNVHIHFKKTSEIKPENLTYFTIGRKYVFVNREKHFFVKYWIDWFPGEAHNVSAILLIWRLCVVQIAFVNVVCVPP